MGVVPHFMGKNARHFFVSVILEGGLGFYNACGTGERQPPAFFFPEPHLFRPLGVTVGCKGDTDIGALRRYLRVCLGFITPAEPGKDNRQRFSSPNPIFSSLWA